MQLNLFSETSLSQLLLHKMLVHILWIYILTFLFGAFLSLFQLSKGDPSIFHHCQIISYAAPIEKKLLGALQIVLEPLNVKLIMYDEDEWYLMIKLKADNYSIHNLLHTHWTSIFIAFSFQK